MHPPLDYRQLTELAARGYVPHPRFAGAQTLEQLAVRPEMNTTVTTQLLVATVLQADYIRMCASGNGNTTIRFQQDHYRVWYQISGSGILQNVTRKTFGTARPGLLGIMEPGERHTYLHQKETFEGFVLDFSLEPSQQTRCYWNAEIEGKKVLEEKQRIPFENQVFDLLRHLAAAQGTPVAGFSIAARASDILAELFEHGLLLFRNEQFPRNKPRQLAEMARRYMLRNYAALQHQRELETECGVDINYLNILFRKQTGQTLYAFLSSVRLEHAAHLLEDETIKITDIAAKVGYPNGNSFARLFRNKTGLTPSQYRDKHRQIRQRHQHPPHNTSGDRTHGLSGQ